MEVGLLVDHLELAASQAPPCRYPIQLFLAAITMLASLKWSTIVQISVVAVVACIWIYLLSTSDNHPEMMHLFPGCYFPIDGSPDEKIIITESGNFQYKTLLTSVVPYRDKVSLSLLPKLKVIVEADGRIGFDGGYPLLLRIDKDRLGFTVPSETREGISYRKGKCGLSAA